MDPILPWSRASTKPVGDFRIFSLRADEKIHPHTGKLHDFYVIDCVDWVNVCAITQADELVMIEQYRHGSDTIELEIPGGMMDPHEQDPLAAGLRELREETGYTGENARIIGCMYPNAAIMSNRCYTVVLPIAHLTHPTQLDHGEDIIVRLVPVADVPRLVAEGRIRHAIVLAALHHFDLWRRGITPSQASAGS